MEPSQVKVEHRSDVRLHAPAAPLDGLRAELASCGWQASALVALLPRIRRHAGDLQPEARSAWQAGLRQAWRQGALAPGADAALLELAAAWADWPLAVAVGRAIECAGDLRAGDAVLLAHALGNLGDTEAALAVLSGSERIRPARGTAAARTELRSWRDWRARHGPLPGMRLEDALLRLEPLGHQHDADFAWQYYDPEIAVRCCLPGFTGVDRRDAWHAWLDGLYASGDELPFAVLHREWGFIGCVHLIRHGLTGFLYYWIGPDWQRQGFATRAASLLLEGARRDDGLRACYAKVFHDNLASRKTLARLGFADLGLPAAAPDGDELFYRLGAPLARADMLGELTALLDNMDTDLRPAPA